LPIDRAQALKINPHWPTWQNEGSGRIGPQPERAEAQSALADSIAEVSGAD